MNKKDRTFTYKSLRSGIKNDISILCEMEELIDTVASGSVDPKYGPIVRSLKSKIKDTKLHLKSIRDGLPTKGYCKTPEEEYNYVVLSGKMTKAMSEINNEFNLMLKELSKGTSFEESFDGLADIADSYAKELKDV
jgi:hypothetical protein